MRVIMYRTGMILILVFIAGCFRFPYSDIKEELTSLMKDQYSATGSDLTFVMCGWPVHGIMKLKSVEVKMNPGSDSSGGSGTADMQAEGEGFSCGGRVFFTYTYGYTGGHGYSGGTDIKPGILNRESDVEHSISNPSAVLLIKTGANISGTFSEGGARLPDGLLCDYYCIELNDKNPAIRIITGNKTNLTIRGCIYQNSRLVSSLPYSGVKLKQGRAIILITAGNKTGNYSFTVEELDEAEKSKLK
jgi:hypothetical protein